MPKSVFIFKPQTEATLKCKATQTNSGHINIEKRLLNLAFRF